MALVHSFEKNGNILFKYRGQIPFILFILSFPVIYFTDYQFLNRNKSLETILLVTCSLVSFAGQLIRAIAIGTSNKYTSGRNTKEQVAEALNTKGIYSTVRHPLYLGNYFMWIGIVMYSFNFWFVITVSLLFWIYYERIMFAEERFLERKFGQLYLDWSSKIPAFWPSFKNYEPNSIPFSLKTILRREYSGITATIIGFVFVAFLRASFESGQIQLKPVYGWVTAIAIGFTLIFRTLKHHTNVLFEEDRS
jgi:protein-S-isoprenylcysteine O-methyltransferase Ste14